jgi:hypothetical protein
LTRQVRTTFTAWPLYRTKKRKYNAGMMHRKYDEGKVEASLLAIIGLSIASVLLIGLSIVLYTQYADQKDNVDAKVETAIAKAQKDQADADAKKFAEREKEPNRQFVGPDDYGRLTFSYPKTWSVYVASATASGGAAFKAYLNPIFVPSTDADGQRYALRVVIENDGFDKVVSQYDSQVKSGDLKSSQTSSNGQSGTRLDGNFSKDVRGAVVIYKVRDKTVSIFTDADTFKPDFEEIIKTIKFNQ